MAQPVRTPQQRQQQRPRPAQQSQRQRTARTGKAAGVVKPFNMPFESKNIMFILIGVAVVTLGYVLMATSDTMGVMAIDVSPVVLLIGYLVIIPLGIMYGAHRKKTEAPAEEVPVVQS